MENDKIIPTHNGLKRIKTYTLDEIFDYLKANPHAKVMMEGEYKVKLQRAKTFMKKGITCVRCGMTGSFFALELDKGNGVHLDLYAIDGGEEVLMTIDHIIPKSMGGVNKMINFQIMCKICNELKGNDMNNNQ
jgi:hypothetical protein